MPVTDTPAIAVEYVLIVRPLDDVARSALARLCTTAGARLCRGRVTLGDGRTHSALLAVREGDGRTLAALLDGGDGDAAAIEPHMTTCTR